MAIDFEAVPGVPIPGGGPMNPYAPGIVIPVLATAASVNIGTRACVLLGYSFREATGVAGAVADLVDGGDDNGAMVAALALSPAFDPAASQTPADQTATGAASAIAPSIGGAAGTTVFITSFRIEGLGATGASVIAATLTGVLGGTITYEVTIPAGAAVAIVPVTDQWGGRGLPASAAGVAITLNVPSFGAGNTFSEAQVQGYVQTAAEVSDTRWLGDSGLLIRSGLRLRVTSGQVKGAAWVRLG